MKKKPHKAMQLTTAELHEFRRLHAETALADERLAHVRTRAQLAQATHEAALLRQANEHTARLSHAQTQQDEATKDLEAARQAAQDFARHLSQAYAVDLKTHLVHPLTGAFVKHAEGTHG